MSTHDRHKLLCQLVDLGFELIKMIIDTLDEVCFAQVAILLPAIPSSMNRQSVLAARPNKISRTLSISI
jgi:hypothetical protein